MEQYAWVSFKYLKIQKTPLLKTGERCLGGVMGCCLGLTLTNRDRLRVSLVMVKKLAQTCTQVRIAIDFYC